ncbi:hypothetical protein ES708_10739 [subsurface metagenome]
MGLARFRPGSYLCIRHGSRVGCPAGGFYGEEIEAGTVGFKIGVMGSPTPVFSQCLASHTHPPKKAMPLFISLPPSHNKKEGAFKPP